MNLLTFIQLILMTILGSNGAKLKNSFFEPSNNQRTEIFNFSTQSNDNRIVARHLYLPPSPPTEPDFVLPEVIDNRVRSSFFQPLLTPINILPSSVALKTPFASEFRYLTPPKQPSVKTSGTLEGDGSEMSRFIKINSMACRNDEEIFFRASITPPKLSDFPVVEGAGSDSCKVVKVNDEYKLDFSNELFWNCGVQDCSTEAGKFYCLNIRFPSVSGLRLNGDVKVILRCRIQERTTSHTKRINIKPIDTLARMAPRIATGGHNNVFETEVGLYRKTLGSEHLFDTKIQPGGTVILGEEILLRAAVREGDGWRYSRISDVTVHYIENSRQKKVMNSVWILNSNGCLNPDIREVCSREQYRVNPLESYLIFQAFMFDNMKETDEMIMNVKVTGCLDGNDCVLNCPGGHSRKSRSLNNSINLNNQTFDWLDDISFRVTLPKPEINLKNSVDNHLIIPYVLSIFILISIIALLCMIKTVYKQMKSIRVPY
ncbi:uncharacterized protein [Chelonus insularis]|uniref:uncharacterized protein n=1 Tax=Chelonus insularis TaxID=460826 RepID=UPI00158E5516|nr:uncharacterized protein LOC118063974 [Chelonus insularis]